MQLIKNISQSEIEFWFICDLTLRFRQTIERFAIAIRDEPVVDSKWIGSKAFKVVRPEVTDRKWNFTKTQQSTFKFSKVQSSESRRLVSVGSPRDFDEPMSDRYLRRLHTINNQRSNQKLKIFINYPFLKNVNRKVKMLTQEVNWGQVR